MKVDSQIDAGMQSERAAKEGREKMIYLPMGKQLCLGIWENKTFLHGPVLAYVLNFSTKGPHPHKFLYPVCTKLLENGTVCRKSLEFGQQCDHDSFAAGDFTYNYRFEVLLSDAEYDGHSLPLWCKISHAASLFLNVSATLFSEWTAQEQYRYVRDVILKVPLCEIYIKVEGREATVQILQSSFATLNRPLSPYLPETSSEDKYKGKMPEIVEQEDNLRDSQTSYKDKGKAKVQEIEEIEEVGVESDDSRVNYLDCSSAYEADRLNSSSPEYVGPSRWSQDRCRPFARLLYSDHEAQYFEPYQEPVISSSPESEVNSAVKLSQLLKKGCKYLIAAFRNRV